MFNRFLDRPLRWGRTCVRLGELAVANSTGYITAGREWQSFFGEGGGACFSDREARTAEDFK